MANSGDVILQEHIKSAPRNSQYWSPDIRNDLICAVEQWIQEKIFEEVRERLSFFLFVLMRLQIHQKNNNSLLCYGLLTKQVREEFISFLLCEFGTTGEALSKIITSALCKYALDLE